MKLPNILFLKWFGLAAGVASFGLSAAPFDMEDPFIDGIENVEKFTATGVASRKAQILASANKATVKAESKGSTDPKVVVVDCDKGKSVQDAIESNTGPVVIEIHGVCSENVQIRRRDNLTIRGTDPQFDGIRGLPVESETRGVLDIRYSDQIRIENLSLNDTPVDGPFAALNVMQSNVIAENCQFDGNARRGVNVRESGAFQGFGLSMSDNGQDGLGANRSSTAFCTGCTFENNNRYAAVSSWGSLISLLQSVVTGPRGLAASIDAYADIDCFSARDDLQYPDCSLNVQSWAAIAQWRSEIVFYVAGVFEGLLYASNHSKVWLYGAEQHYDGERWNNIQDTSELKVEATRIGGTVYEALLSGDTYFWGLSKGLLLDARDGNHDYVEAITLDGIVHCQDAASVWADPSVTYTEGSGGWGCQHLPEPPDP